MKFLLFSKKKWHVYFTHYISTFLNRFLFSPILSFISMSVATFLRAKNVQRKRHAGILFQYNLIAFFFLKVYRLINLHQIHHLTLISRNLSYVKLWYFSYRKVMGQNALKTTLWYVFKIGWSNIWIIYIKRNPTSHEWNFLPNFRSTGIFLDFCTPLYRTLTTIYLEYTN